MPFSFPPLIRAMIRGDERKEFDLVETDPCIIIKHINEGWRWENPIRRDK